MGKYLSAFCLFVIFTRIACYGENALISERYGPDSVNYLHEWNQSYVVGKESELFANSYRCGWYPFFRCISSMAVDNDKIGYSYEKDVMLLYDLEMSNLIAIFIGDTRSGYILMYRPDDYNFNFIYEYRMIDDLVGRYWIKEPPASQP